MAGQGLDEQVATLINEGLPNPDKDARLLALQQVQELVVHKDPSLVDNFFEEILQFQHDGSPDVRRHLLVFIEEACGRDPRLLPKAVPTLGFLVQDSANKVVKKCVQSAALLHRAAFLELAGRPANEQSHLLWEAASTLRDDILALRAAENDGVRTAVLKYLEALVLLYSYRTRGTDSKRARDASLDNVPLNHAVLDADKLRREGQTYFATLIGAPREAYTSSSGCLAAVGALVSIARQRPTFLAAVCRCLCSLVKEPPSQLKPAQVKSLRRTLKTQMLALLQHPESGRFHEQLVPALEALEADPMEVSQYDRRAEMRSRALAGQKRGRSATTEGSAAAAAAAAADTGGGDGATPAAIAGGAAKRPRGESEAGTAPSLALNALVKLPLPAVVELVMGGLARLPPEMPASLGAGGGVVGSGLQARASRAALRDPRAAGSDEIAASFADSAGGSGTAESGSGVGGTDVKEEAASKQEVTEEDESVAAALPAPAPTPKRSRNRTAGSIRPRRTGPFVLKAAPLDKDTRALLLSGAFGRMLEGAQRLTVAGADRARLSLVCRLLALQQLFGAAPSDELCTVQDPLTRCMLDYVRADVGGRLDLALAWLHQEYAVVVEAAAQAALSQERAKKTRKKAEKREALAEAEAHAATHQAAAARYEAAAVLFVDTVGATLEPRDRIFLRAVVELPALPAGLPALLDAAVRDEKRVYVGVAALRDLVLTRPPARETCLPLLLGYTQSPNIVERTQSILVCKKLHALPPFCQAVEAHACAQMERLMGPPPSAQQPTLATKEGGAMDTAADNSDSSDTNKWTEDAVVNHLSLYLALMPHSPALLHGLVDLYVRVPPAVKMVVLRSLYAPVAAIGPRDETLRSVIADCPKGAETLVLKAIHVLADKVAPEAGLVEVVRRLYAERTHDARFLIPVVTGLRTDEVVRLLPKFLCLPGRGWTETLSRLIGGDHGPSPVRPAELLVALHRIDPAREEGLDMRTLMSGVNACFARKDVYKQEVLAVALQQLIELQPLPTLLMRTVIQTLQLSPRLKGFVVREILTRLIGREVWQHAALWQGFVKCIQKVQPDSLEVLRLLPAAQLKHVLQQPPSMRAPFVKYLKALPAFTRARLPPAVMEVVGEELAEEATSAAAASADTM